MAHRSPLGALSQLSSRSSGVFRGSVAVELGVSRKQLAALASEHVIERELPDTYRMTTVPRSSEQRLWCACLWAGPDAVAAGRSAGEVYALEGVRAVKPEIIVPRSNRSRHATVTVRRSDARLALMVRRCRGLPVAGVEPTLVDLATTSPEEAFEVACEDARRRRLTSTAALRAYIARFGPRPGVARTRELLDEIDPVYPSRSTLEVKTRRVLVANGFTDFVREFPLEWNGRTYRYDFGFERRGAILETNGRRWHDDPTDYERDNDKWSVPGRHGYRIVFATWAKVTRYPDALLEELDAALAA